MKMSVYEAFRINGRQTRRNPQARSGPDFRPEETTSEKSAHSQNRWAEFTVTLRVRTVRRNPKVRTLVAMTRKYRTYRNPQNIGVRNSDERALNNALQVETGK